jgi:hypothetical protein
MSLASISQNTSGIEEALINIAVLAGIDDARHRPFIRLMTSAIQQVSLTPRSRRRRPTGAQVARALDCFDTAIGSLRHELGSYISYPEARGHGDHDRWTTPAGSLARTIVLLVLVKSSALLDDLDHSLQQAEDVVGRARLIAKRIAPSGRPPAADDLRMFLTTLVVTVHTLGGRLPHSALAERVNPRSPMAQALAILRPHLPRGFLPDPEASTTLLRLLNEARRQSNVLRRGVVRKGPA